MIKRFAKLTIDIRKAVFLCIAIGLLVSAGILTVFLVSAERSPFLLRCNMKLCEIIGCNNKHEAKGLCKKHYDKQYHQDNKEHIIKYRKDNKEHHAEYMRQYRIKNKDRCVEWARQGEIRNKEHRIKQHKIWYENNKEHKNKQQKQNYLNNKEYYMEKHKQYNNEHKKQIAKYQKKWCKTPIGKASAKARNHNRRAMTKGLTIATVRRVYEDNIKKYGVLTCYLCGKPIVFGDERLKDSLDHSTPVTREGSNNYENLGIAHLVCNLKKGTKTLEEYNAVIELKKGK